MPSTKGAFSLSWNVCVDFFSCISLLEDWRMRHAVCQYLVGVYSCELVEDERVILWRKITHLVFFKHIGNAPHEYKKVRTQTSKRSPSTRCVKSVAFRELYNENEYQNTKRKLLNYEANIRTFQPTMHFAG